VFAPTTKFKKFYSLLKENEMLIRIGAYQKGADKELDEAMTKKNFMDDFIRQDPNEGFELSKTEQILSEI